MPHFQPSCVESLPAIYSSKIKVLGTGHPPGGKGQDRFPLERFWMRKIRHRDLDWKGISVFLCRTQESPWNNTCKWKANRTFGSWPSRWVTSVVEWELNGYAPCLKTAEGLDAGPVWMWKTLTCNVILCLQMPFGLGFHLFLHIRLQGLAFSSYTAIRVHFCTFPPICTLKEITQFPLDSCFPARLF